MSPAADPERRARALVELALVRFWPQVEPDGPVPPHAPELGPSWVWTGARNEWGYGVIKYAGEQLAHRVSWRLHVGRSRRGSRCATGATTGRASAPPTRSQEFSNRPRGCI